LKQKIKYYSTQTTKETLKWMHIAISNVKLN